MYNRYLVKGGFIVAQEISKESLIEQVRKKAHDYELQFHGCSQSILLAFQELLGMDDELTFKAAGPLCAGLGMGKTCGALTGGMMVLGMKYGRTRIDEGLGGLFSGILIAQSLVQRFEQEYGTTACSEISRLDWTDSDAVIQAVTNPEFLAMCANVVGTTAEMVAEIIAEVDSHPTHP
jgi:C_GCAxxG_C_C family probable redox protein